MIMTMKKMGSMVRTYMMLCIAGLVFTCLIMVIYRRDSTSSQEIAVNPPPIRHAMIPNPLRNIKGTNLYSSRNGNNLFNDDDDENNDEANDYSDDTAQGDNEDADRIGRILDEDEDDNTRRTKQGKKNNLFHENLQRTFVKITSNDIPDSGTIEGARALANQKVPAGVPGGATMERAQDTMTMRRDGTKIGTGTFKLDGTINGARTTGARITGAGGAQKTAMKYVLQDLPQGDLQTNSGTRLTSKAAVLFNGTTRFTTGGDRTTGGAGTKSVTKKTQLKLGAGVQDLLGHPGAHRNKANQTECTPKNNIFLMKTHKCSSSTMQNILFRWGEDHNLTFALPRDGGVYFGSPNLFSPYYVMPVKGETYNIMCNHMRYSDQVKSIMPADTVYIGILRNPKTQYESMYTYYRFDSRFSVPIEKFMENPKIYFGGGSYWEKHAGRNPMLYDMGLDARNLDGDEKEVQDYIDKIIATFDLVMIAEYFKESLILLKNILCWSTDDITFFDQNARSKSSVQELTPLTKQRIAWWNAADYKLYEHFNRTLWEKIDAFGRDRMAAELEELDRKNEALTNLCIRGTLHEGDKRVWYPDGINVKSFVLSAKAKKNRLCQQMTKPELTYMNHIRQLQIQRMWGR